MVFNKRKVGKLISYMDEVVIIIISQKLILKMKVYTASKVRKAQYHLNQNIKSNIHQLAALLKTSSSHSLSLSPSAQTINAQEQAINLAKQFVSNLSDPFQCMMLYPLVLDCSFTCAPNWIFKHTSFPQQLHPLLSLFLYKCTSFSLLERKSRRLIDLFYRYVNEQGSQAYDAWIRQENNKSIGQWFYTECISNFYHCLYKEQDLYTIFISNYLKFGLSYLFISAVAFLKGITTPPECDAGDLQRLNAKFIHKYLGE